ncbi:hypothetical protein HPB49_021400 [Dermacentor silvarum]|uniref:Uncharacterized protein n=1 Tax=Dermacentor silvarum TaxID=543639 RepID=A0ACB8CT92_DERSI|nr:uncharacterized protein LOC125945738 [Dermacentor silvarum]KAH7950234.1 hypothetical protein HPB49_021400 [Dermacentor silvarum]
MASADFSPEGRPPESSTAQSGSLVPADLCTATGYFTGTPIGPLLTHCTATQRRKCDIIDHLPAFNEILFHANLQLREMYGRWADQLCISSLEDEHLLWPKADEAQLRQANALLRWLFKTHSCLQHVCVLSYEGSGREALYDGLKRNAYIRTLKMESLCIADSEDLYAQLCSLGGLEELEFAKLSSSKEKKKSVLSTLLSFCPSLTVLRISQVCADGDISGALLTALKSNSVLKELSVHGSVITSAEPDDFAEYLMYNTTLITLTITASTGNRRKSFRWSAEGLIRNKTIQNLNFNCIFFSTVTVPLAARLFTENKVLRSFKMVCSTTLAVVRGINCVCLLDALKSNEALERLLVPFSLLDPSQWVHFFWTMSRKERLQKLTVDVHKGACQHLRGMCRALEESGAETKVSLRTHNATSDLDLIQSKAFSKVELHCSPEDVQYICGLLLSSNHVTSVRLHVCTDHDELCSVVASYIRAAPLLRKLHLSLYTDDDDVDDGATRSWTAITESLSRSRNIIELRVDVDYDMGGNSLDDHKIQQLADVFRLSKTIRRAYFEADDDTVTASFFRFLSVNIGDNYILLKVNTNTEWTCDESTGQCFFAVWDTVRRNSDILTRAAQFMQGRPLDRRRICALERVRRHPPLLEELAKRLSLSVAEVSTMARRGIRSVEGLHSFMRHVGVVRRSVVCNRRQDGRPQLDTIGEDCWSLIRRYLTLEDVRVATAPAPISQQPSNEP